MATRLNTALDRRAELKAEGLKLLDIAASNRTDEQSARLDAIDKDITAIDGDIDRLRRMGEEERAQATSDFHQERVTAGGVKTTGRWESGDEEKLAKFAPNGAPIVYHGLPRMDAATAMRYAFGRQLQDVYSATTRHTLSEPLAQLQAAAQGAGEKIGSDGGFMVQTDLAAGIIQNVFTGGALLNAVRQINLGENSNGISMRAVDETSRATGSRWGGVQAYWVDEGTGTPATKPKFRKLELKLNKLAALGYATDELLADFVAMGDVMFQAFTEEVRFLVEDSILNGTGAGMPTGILRSASLVSTTRTTSSRVKHADVIAMWARMHARAKANAVWLANTDVNPDLDQLFFTGATNDVPVRFVTYGEDGVMRIKGKPVIETEYNATLGTVGDLMLVDLSQYLFIQKLLQTAASMHVAFATDEMAFRVTWRVDGKPAWVSALTPFKGSATQSPFVAIAT